jgi:hypothetical protein
MSKVDLGREPPDASFDHPPSRRRYQVVRRDGKMWHRELLLTDGPEEVILAEHPVNYVVGSGRHSLTYLVESDGFFFESPVTWYRSKQAWGMSPGYDDESNQGFERAIGEGCLHCHSGQSVAIGGSLHRMRVQEAAIGCERCHGPGQLHLERHRRVSSGKQPKSSSRDETIVNPARLPRELAEAVCQQCHLRSTATVLARGKLPGQFRPGQRRQDFLIDFASDEPDDNMTVVGHVEQLHLSKCYIESKTLTCLTCHSPHEEPSEANKVGYYQAVCISCHEMSRCKVPSERLRKERPDNSCFHCHMPSSPTEIPHLAFTHHRIGKPAASATRLAIPAQQGSLGLRPVLPISHLLEIDKQRAAGLAHLEASLRPGTPEQSARHRKKALSMLIEVKHAGLTDPLVDIGLASLMFDDDKERAASLAEESLSRRSLLPAQEQCNALYLMAHGKVLQGEYREARQLLQGLTGLRRSQGDFYLLARVESLLGNPSGEAAALEEMVKVTSRQWRIHHHLAKWHQQQGSSARAHWHARRARP